MLEAGTVLDGKYRILSVIGRGGMSTVYLAINDRANRPWAVKEIRRDDAPDYDILRHSLRVETEILRQLRHPGLPEIGDVIENEDSFLIVMDYIRGRTLESILNEKGSIPQSLVISWARDLCDILIYLHIRDKPVIYRDMKPDNVMLDPDGRIYLIDFGIARIHKGTGRGDTTCLGTRGYAAPEQFMTDAESDERTDIYNLGATLYHLLTGHMVDEAGLNPVPARYYIPSLSPGLEMILSKALQPDPAKRYRSAAAMKYALDHYRELDRKFRIKACLTSAVFATMTAAAAFMIISSLRIRQDADMLLESTRTDFIDMAKGATASEERMRGIIGAQTLDPESSDAMMLLLDLDTGDGNYTRGEDEEVRQILYSGYDDSRTYEEVMKANAHDYALFAYRLGIAYFYQYENTGNKQMAEKWFRIAANSGKLSESQAFRAEKLYSICSYYTAMGKPDETGDSRICYADYLDDLNNTVAGDIAAADNMTTALIIYKETAAEVYNNAWYFSREGVPRQESDKLLKEIETHLDTDFEDVSPASAERIKKMIAQTRTNIELATEQLDEAYAQSEN